MDEQAAPEPRVDAATKEAFADALTHKANALGYRMEVAAALSGLGRTTMFEAARRGELRVTKVGRRTIVLHEDLVDWLHQHREAA